MPAPKGNQNGVKLKPKDVRQRAYHQYCDWIAQGKSPRSFTFEEGNYKCIGETIESYMKDEVEFPPIHKKFAFSKGYARWEQVVEDSAEGKNKEANTASLQMIMRNKYSWDKPEQGSENHKGHVIDFAQGVRSESLSETENSDQDLK